MSDVSLGAVPSMFRSRLSVTCTTVRPANAKVNFSGFLFRAGRSRYCVMRWPV